MFPSLALGERKDGFAGVGFCGATGACGAGLSGQGGFGVGPGSGLDPQAEKWAITDAAKTRRNIEKLNDFRWLVMKVL